jgi:hypothetical protein
VAEEEAAVTEAAADTAAGGERFPHITQRPCFCSYRAKTGFLAWIRGEKGGAKHTNGVNGGFLIRHFNLVKYIEDFLTNFSENY